MSNKKYNLTWAKIGNASGFRLSDNFFKDYPEFKEAKCAVEIIRKLGKKPVLLGRL